MLDTTREKSSRWRSQPPRPIAREKWGNSTVCIVLIKRLTATENKMEDTNETKIEETNKIEILKEKTFIRLWDILSSIDLKNYVFSFLACYRVR